MSRGTIWRELDDADDDIGDWGDIGEHECAFGDSCPYRDPGGEYLDEPHVSDDDDYAPEDFDPAFFKGYLKGIAAAVAVEHDWGTQLSDRAPYPHLRSRDRRRRGHLF